MKNSKRLLSFLLVFLMMFPIFADTAYAMSSIMSTKDTENELEGRVAGNQEVFEFDSSIINTKEEWKISKEKQASSEAQSSESTVFRSMPQPMRGPQSESDDTTIELTTVGLDNQAFDWSVFPDRSFKITVKWNTNDGKTHVKENFATLTENGTTTYNVGWPKDGSMTGNVSIVVDFNNNVKIMAVASRPTSTPDGAGIKFSFKVMQLPNTIAEVIYVDPYGNPLNEGMPQDSANMPNVTIDELPDIQDIKLTNKSETLNFRESEDFDEVEANKLANGLTFKVDGKTTGEKVTIDDKDYKLDISEPNPKEQGTIKLAYQADVLVPPVDPKQPDSGTPVPTPEGYVRLTFDANENKANGVKGIFTNDSPYKGKDKSYIDVKEGIQYDNESLTKAIKALTVQGTKDQKEYTQDLQNPWTPEILTAGAVSEATYNANYKHSIAEEITEAGGLKGIDLAAFVGDTLDSTFWKNGVALADTVTDTEGKLQALLNAATVTDATEPARTSETKGTFPGTLKVKFADNSELTVDQKLFVYNKKDEKPTDPTQPTPEDAVVVTYTAGEGVSALQGTGKTLVKSGETLDDSDFPTAVVNTAEGYKEPATWTPADRVVTAQNNAFTASATKQNKDIIGPVDPGVTPNPDPKQYWTVTFKSADTATGTVAAKNTYYVLKTANKTLADVTAPATTPAPGYKFDKWTPALDKNTAIDKDIDVVGTFVKTVTPPGPQQVSETPIINPIYDNDGFVTGEGTPGSTIEVRFPDGEIVETIVDRFGKWEVEVPYRLYEGEIVEARQYEEGKDPSYYVDERVRHFERHWNDKDKDKDKKDEEKTTKPVTPKKVWTPKQLNARDHWAYIKGYQDLTFKPNGNITRAEVAMIFARLSVNKQVVNAPKFSDVKDGDWYKKAVDIVASQGIVKGYEDGSFRPNQPITRREFAAIAARYAGNIDAWKTFRDVTPNDWAYTLINKVAGMGWINGYQDGTFKPNNNITRAESIAIINRMLNRKADPNFTISNYDMLNGKFHDVKPTDWYYFDVFEAAFGHTFERMEDGVNEKWNRIVDMMFGLN